MATISRILIVSLLLYITTAAATYRPIADIPPGINTCPVPLQKCGSECDRRCSETSHKKNCLMFCNMCCKECLCVPPGTFGNKECCSCYNNRKTKKGGPKCP